MSENKEAPDNYYRTHTHLSRRGPSSEYEQPVVREYSDSTKYQRMPSEHSLKNQRKEQFNQPNRRQNYVISNLRNQLQNIKSEVVKLMSHDSPAKIKITGSDQLIERMDRLERVEYPTTRADRFADNSSSSSFALSRPKTKPRLPTEGLNKQRYFELQNQILKNELKNLKNKYVLRKNEYKEEKDTLHKKIYFLEDVIARNEEDMADYKAEIETEINTIRNDMVGRISTNSEPPYSQTQLMRSPSFDRENEELKQQVFYLRKRTAEANEEIKKMAIENNDLNNLLKSNKKTNDSELLEHVKFEYSEKLKEKDRILVTKDEQIANLLQKQEMANEIVAKNAQLIEALNVQRERIKQIQFDRQTQCRLLPPPNQNNHEYEQLQRQHHQLIQLYQNAKHQNNSLQTDLHHLSNVLTDLKMQNQLLQMNKPHPQPQPQPQEVVGASNEVLELTAKNNQLNEQIAQIRGFINGMVQETAQKLSEMEMDNQYLQNRIAELQKQNLNLNNELSMRGTQQIQSPKSMLKKSSLQDPSKSQRRVEELQSWKITLEQSLEAKERQIGSFRYELKKFSQLYSSKCKQVQQIQQHYSNEFQAESGKQSYLNSIIGSLSKKLEQVSNTSNQTISDLRQQLEILSKNDQNQQIIELKQLLRVNSEEIQRLRADIARYRYALDNLESSIQMERVKFTSEKKNIETSMETQIQGLRNELNISTRTIDSLTTKLQFVSEELIKKDQYIGQYIKQGDQEISTKLEELRASYEELFSIEKLKKTLSAELLEIQRLSNDNITLMKHITRLQEEQTISNGNLHE